jgi:hypothetical protein
MTKRASRNFSAAPKKNAPTLYDLVDEHDERAGRATD